MRAVNVSMLCPVSITPLGLPVVPPGPGDHGDIVWRIRLPGLLAASAVQPRPQRDGTSHLPGRRFVKADQRGELGQVSGYPCDERRERPGEDQAGAVEQVQQFKVLGCLAARVDRAPDRPRPGRCRTRN